MRVFQDKMSGWIKDKALFTTQQAEALKLESEAKREIRQLKTERERELTKLLKQEITERIRQQAEKHTPELELITLQKNKILHNM